MECQYSLLSYGLPIKAMPVTGTGEIKKASHAKWMSRRRAVDEKLKAGIAFHGVDVPGLDDVLLGRGKPIQSYPGNVRLRSTIEKFKNTYDTARMGQKSVICSKIVESIQKEGGRFLKLDTDGFWVEATEDEVSRKVCVERERKT